MKVLILIICVTFLSFSEEMTTTDVMKALGPCKHEYNCTEGMLDIMRNFKVPKSNECLSAWACMAKKLKMIDDQDKLDSETARMFYNKFDIYPGDVMMKTRNCVHNFTGVDIVKKAKSILECINFVGTPPWYQKTSEKDYTAHVRGGNEKELHYDLGYNK